MQKDIMLVDPYTLSDEEIKNYVDNYKNVDGVLYDHNGNMVIDEEELRRYETSRRIRLMALMTVGTAILENRPRRNIESYFGLAREQVLMVSRFLDWPIGGRSR